MNVAGYVYAQTIDSLLPLQNVDVLKINLGGSDYRALLGARACLMRSHPVIFAELAPAALARLSKALPGDYIRFLAECGYDEFTILSPDHDASIDSIQCRNGSPNTSHLHRCLTWISAHGNVSARDSQFCR